jgi:hypothetical protein
VASAVLDIAITRITERDAGYVCAPDTTLIQVPRLKKTFRKRCLPVFSSDSQHPLFAGSERVAPAKPVPDLPEARR